MHLPQIIPQKEKKNLQDIKKMAQNNFKKRSY